MVKVTGNGVPGAVGQGCCSLLPSLEVAWKYLRFILARKAAQDWRNMWEMVPGIGDFLGALGLIEEIKSPCGGRGFRWDRIRKDGG